jgi:magnesium transporter
MIRAFANDAGRLRPLEGPFEFRDDLVWVDLAQPTAVEEAEVERLLGVDIPTREEMSEIEISSRLYHEDDAIVMTATLPAQVDGDKPVFAPVSFVLTPERLITVRYHEPRAFQTFPVRAAKTAMGCANGEGVLLALLEVTVDRLADILERAVRDIDGISHDIFRPTGHPERSVRSRNLQAVLESIGAVGDLTSGIRDCLVTLERLVSFFGFGLGKRGKVPKESRERIRTLSRDIHSLTDHAGFLSQKITFLLDATLGMINIEQNAIIKIFSVAAVVFLPPTLIASIYGMNFEHMPELSWPFGYPLAIGLMVASAILPYQLFKRRGWL